MTQPAATTSAPPAPGRRRRRWPTVLAVLAGLVALLLIVATLGYEWLLRRPLPVTSGTLTVAGLDHQVRVVRDGWGVPQVYADDAHDLFFAQGYVQAQDRFWEMDVRRHITAGRLAEMFGRDQVDVDRFVRTLGWRRTAQRELALMSPQTRAALDAYSAGVNAYVGSRSQPQLAVEYDLLKLVNRHYVVEPWGPVDSLAWLKAMAWDLRSNLDEESLRTLYSSRVGVARAEQLFPRYPFARHQPIVPSGAVVRGEFAPHGSVADASARPVPRAAVRAVADARSAALRLGEVLGPAGSGVGSNSWAVSASRTATGGALLANDPHLEPMLPSIWYQMGLHCTTVSVSCPYDVAGFTFSGTPGVIIGHNDRVAWGFTNLGPDVADQYLEKVSGDRYLQAGRWRPLSVRTETIKVAGGDTVSLVVRSTDDGPLISGVDDRTREVGRVAPVGSGAPPRGDGYAVSLRWTALQPGTTGDAILRIDTARSFAEFRAAAREFQVPAQNMLYADVDGNIGYQAPGLVPVRGKGDGRWPAPGWDPSYRWRGWVPFAALPYVYDPPSGYIVTANNAVIGPSYPYRLTEDWAYGYRSQRIVDRLRTAGPLDVAGMAAIQTDTWNGNAQTLVPYLLAVTLPGSADSMAARARDLLRGWDLTQPPDSAAAMYFNAVWRHLLADTFGDELRGDDTTGQLEPDGGDRWFEVVRGLLTAPTSRWWDDTRTASTETRDAILRRSMLEAAGELSDRLGNDPSSWRWGDMHTLVLENQTFGTSGVGPLEKLLNRGPVRLGGGESIVDATAWNAHEGYQVDWVPSMRMVVDLGNLDASRWVNLTGASGHVASPHYWDQTPLWRDGRTTAFPFTAAAVDGAAQDTLLLRPAG